MNCEIPEYVLAVLQGLETSGFEAFLVGGCVRDFFLRREVHDFDVTTNALPQEVMRIFPNTVPTGLKHGTVTVHSREGNVEVTTYRIDLGYSDGRRPDTVVFSHDLVEDLARRDFTVNAMAMDKRQSLRDPFGGLQDLRARVIKAVGNPQERLREDALRILRALRLSAELDFTIDASTELAMQQLASSLVALSRERVGQELLRIARANWWPVLPLLVSGTYLYHFPSPWAKVHPGLLRLLAVSGMSALWQNLLQQFHRRTNAKWWKALPQGAGQRVEMDRAALSVALWLHFAAVDAEDAVGFCRTLAWTNSTARSIKDIVHLVAVLLSGVHSEAWRANLYQFGIDAVYAAACLADLILIGKPCSSLAQECIAEAARMPIWSLRQLALNGTQLVDAGFEGAQIGRILQYLCEEVLAGRLANDMSSLWAFVEKGCVSLNNQRGLSKRGDQV